MNFETLSAISFFCAGAIFSLMDIGSDSYLAYEYWSNSEYRSFQHCVEYRLSAEVETGDYKSSRQMRGDFCENWKEKWMNAGKEAERTDCLKTLLNGTQVELNELTYWTDDDFKKYTIDKKEVQWMWKFCINAEMKHLNASGSPGLSMLWLMLMTNKVDIRDIYGNEEECHLHYRENVVKRLKAMLKNALKGAEIVSNIADAEWESFIDQFKKQEKGYSKLTNEEVKSNLEKQTEFYLILSTITNEELKSASEVFLNFPVKSHKMEEWWFRVLDVSAHCKDWKKRPIPVKTVDVDGFDASLVSNEVPQRIFAILTTTWIAAGGLFQFFIVLYLFRRGDSTLHVLPEWMRVLLLVASPILLGPVVVYFFGVVFVVKHIKNELIYGDIHR